MPEATSLTGPTVEAFALMDQLPQEKNGLSLRAESPLHHVQLPTLATHDEGRGVELEELKFLGHLVIRGSIDNKPFMSGAKKILGTDLPGPLQSKRTGKMSIYWISPDEWLVIVPGEQTFQLEHDLRKTMDGHCAVVNVSGGQTVICLSGDDAINVLKKSTPYDVHIDAFPVGKVVTSVFAKSQAVILRSSLDSWELVIRRSFAEYAWLWLQEACAEYGLVIKE